MAATIWQPCGAGKNNHQIRYKNHSRYQFTGNTEDILLHWDAMSKIQTVKKAIRQMIEFLRQDKNLREKRWVRKRMRYIQVGMKVKG